MTDAGNLGLPIEYQQLPSFFDAHNVGADTEKKNALIEQLLAKQGVKRILDLTCGTGSQVFYLAQRGYEVVGNDLSSALIEQAQNKAQEKDLSIKFYIGDMRTAQLGCFDAVITIFSAIGHVNKQGFVQTLQNIRDNLIDGGIYIFDIFNLQALTDEVIKTFVMDIKGEVDGVRFRNQQYSEIDREQGLLISHDCYTLTKPGQAPEQHKNTFALQVYTVAELNALLSENGFEVLEQYDGLNILTVAQKV